MGKNRTPAGHWRASSIETTETTLTSKSAPRATKRFRCEFVLRLNAASEEQDEDRGHDRTGIGIAGDADTADSGRPERGAAKFFARGIRGPRGAYPADSGGGGCGRPAGGDHGGLARPED